MIIVRIEREKKKEQQCIAMFVELREQERSGAPKKRHKSLDHRIVHTNK